MVSGNASAAISVATTAGGSQLTTSPTRSLRDGTPASPFTVTAACPICRASCDRDTDPICSARNRSSRCPTAAGATTNRRAAVTSPDLRLDVAPRLQKHVDQGAIVDPLLEDLGRHAALVERAPLFDLVAHGVEQVLPLDPSTIFFSWYIERSEAMARASYRARSGLSMRAMPRSVT